MTSPARETKRETVWDRASPAERKRLFGSHDNKAAWDARQKELIRRYKNHLHLSRADRREARQLLKGVSQ